MAQLEWKIWFGYFEAFETPDEDGNLGVWKLVTRTNLDTPLAGLPILPVVLIINIRRDHNGVRWGIEKGKFYYDYVDGKEWWASSLSGHHNYVDTHRGRGTTLRGGMIPNPLFDIAYRQAKVDPEILAVTQIEFERERGEAGE